MGSNRLKLLLLSMMAVFAISAVASASASALGGCYQVVEKGTGTFEKPTCEGAAGTKEFIKVIELTFRMSAVGTRPAVWCARVAAGTGVYEDNECTKLGGTKEYIKVLVPHEWEVCQEGGTEEFTEHLCKTKAAKGKWSWLPLFKKSSFTVESTGLVFTLTAGGKTITCKKVTDEGTIKEWGADEATKITFTECTTGTAGCEVKNKGGALKTVVVSEIPTQLEEVGGKLVDKFEQKLVGATKEFVTLEFEGASCAAAGYVTTKVKGDVAAEVKNETNGEVKLTFPTTPITQTPKLEAFGVAATLVGVVSEKLKNGWAFRGV